MHYDGASSYLFVNGTEIIKFKAKDSQISAYPLCLRNISNWSVDDMKKTGLKGCVMSLVLIMILLQFFNILDIHKYLMKKNGIV